MRPLLTVLVFAAMATVLPCQISGHQNAAKAPPVKLKWDYYQATANNWNNGLRVELTQQVGTEADIYVRRGQRPTEGNYDFKSARIGTSNELILVNQTTSPALSTDTWHIGVRHSVNTSYSISYRFEAESSTHSGLGSIPYKNGPTGGHGTSFRVWAPNAVKVSLTGDFNSWNSSNAPMSDDGDGNWSLDVRNLLAGTHYQYVITSSAGVNWKNDPRALQVTNSTGNSIVVDQDDYDWSGDNFSMPDWNDLVIYEMHLGTFNDTAGGTPGTIQTAAQKIDYLAGLGINAIELMPFCEFAGDFSWGYNYSYPFAVESHYGSPEQLKAFIKLAHSRGIAVLGDLIFNHWGPSDMDMWQFDGWSTSSTYGGIYFYNDWRAVTPWGDTRPDMGRNEVRQYIRDNVLMWLEEYRFDGIRFDSTSYMRNVNGTDLPEAWSLLQWLNDEIDSRVGWKLSIAEDMWSNEWITKDTGSGGTGFDSQWDPNFVHPIRNAAIVSDDNSRNMWDVKNAITYSYNGNPTQRVIYTESHDEVSNGHSRLPEEIWPGNADSWFSKKRSTLAAALVMTSPGIPMLFQGQEILEDGFFDDADPIDWTKLVSHSGINNLYKDLISLRRDFNGNTRGLKGSGVNVHHVNDNDKVIAFHRWDNGGAGDDVIVICNFGYKWYTSYLIGMPNSGNWYVRFNSDAANYDSSFGDYGDTVVNANSSPRDGMSHSVSLKLAPYCAVILSQ